MIAPHELVVDRADLDGFQVGKAAALGEWQAKREAEEYDRLFNRLYQRNWARKKRAADPEAARERQRRWRDENREHVRTVARERMRRKAAANRRSCVCEECGTRWTPQRRARFCSKRCRNRWHGKHPTPQRKAKRNRGIRNMSVSTAIAKVLRREPWLTLGEIVARAAGTKRGSVATLLTTWAQQGRLVHNGAKKGRRYALPGATLP